MPVLKQECTCGRYTDPTIACPIHGLVGGREGEERKYKDGGIK